MKKNLAFLALSLGALAGSRIADATEGLTEAIEAQVESNRAAAAAQQSIDKLGAQTRQMLDDYREALRQSEALNVYNAHVRQLIESQEAEHRSLEGQLGEVEATRREIVPLMLRMTAALERLVQVDRPFLPEERARRVAQLKELMGRADVGDAAKFHHLLEAYQVENEYGKTIEAYRAELKDGDHGRTVDFLRIGRVALFYQSLDGRQTGVWNHKAGRWQELPGEYNTPIRKGLAIARKERAPELLPIAVTAPEAAR